MMATEPPPSSGFPNFNQDFSSFSGQSLHSFHPDGNSLDGDEVSWGNEGNGVEFQHNHAENSAEGPSPPNNWSQMPEKSIGFSNILSKLSAGASTPPLAPKDPDTTTPLKFTSKKELAKNPNLNPTAKVYAPSPPVSPPFESRRSNPNANPWSLDNGSGMHNKQQNNSPAPNSWVGNGGAWGSNGNTRQFDRNRGVRGGPRNDQPATSFVIRPAEPSQEDRYECTRLPSGIVVQTHSGQAVEFWERVHVPRSMFDISGLGPNS